MGPLDPDAHPIRSVEIAVGIRGLVVLRSLEVLRHVRVEVILPRHHARLHGAVQGTPQPHRRRHCGFVHHGQRTGQAKTDRAHVGVRFGAEFVGAATEQLRLRRELDVHFEADDELPFVGDRRFMNVRATVDHLNFACP